MLPDEAMEMEFFLLRFFPFPRVRAAPLLLILLSIIGLMHVRLCPANKRQKKRKEYKQFVRQLYHACLQQIFEPLRAGMSTPEVVRCPDGHYRRAIYSIGPVIADYPEQVWLTGIVQGWCPKCKARPDNLDNPQAPRRTRKRTNTLLETGCDPGDLWSEHGLRDDVVVSLKKRTVLLYNLAKFLSTSTM